MKYLIAFFCLFLISCSSTIKPSPVIIVEKELIPLNVPELLLYNIEASSPPNKDNYLELNYKGKEEVLTNYIIKLIGNLDSCNSSISNIRVLINKQNEIIN